MNRCQDSVCPGSEKSRQPMCNGKVRRYVFIAADRPAVNFAIYGLHSESALPALLTTPNHMERDNLMMI
jgi:hypothetical protein